MRKLYVPISMDPTHGVDAYDADFKRLGVDTVFFTEPERIVLESQDRYDLIMKRISECVKTYEGLGYECGMWISTLGYGGPLNAFGKENNFTRGSFPPWDQTHVSCSSCIGRWILYH